MWRGADHTARGLGWKPSGAQRAPVELRLALLVLRNTRVALHTPAHRQAKQGGCRIRALCITSRPSDGP